MMYTTFYSLPSPCSLQMQLASLEENKQQSTKRIQDLQKTIDLKASDIKSISQQITAKKGQQTDAARMSLELEHMKTRMLALEEEVSSLRGAANLSREEASCYKEMAERTTALLRATPTKVKLRA